MNNKHLWWIISLSLIVGALIGMFFYATLQINENQHMFSIAMCCMEELYNTTTNFCMFT